MHRRRLPDPMSRLSIAAISLVVCVLGPARTLAQSAEAEALFNDAARLMIDGKIAEACEAFESSNRIEPRAGTLIRLGECRDGVLQHPGRPYGLASAISGIVLASATCGNGRLDPGEDCDTGGASATCDADCTSPVCSDGVFNPAAGEVCDFGLGDPTCNLSCNGPPVCGDGKYDWFTEQCDDGNTVNGDGCSSTCQPENLCGNGRVDRVTIYEECDDGNRIDDDGCSNTCRLPYCGDGMLQSARGESCDDGNMISGDGCDSHCQIEPPPA